MSKIGKQNRAIRVLVVARAIKLTRLALSRAEVTERFMISKRGLDDALASGLLGYSLSSDSELIPAWRLERLYLRRRRQG